MTSGRGKSRTGMWIAIAVGAAIGVGLVEQRQPSAPAPPPVQRPAAPGQPPSPGSPPGSPIVAVAKPPVDLDIANLRQDTPVWCWAAVSQQIIAATRGLNATPPQCALVATADGNTPDACCQVYNQACVHTGSLEQISGLIQRFGGRTSAITRPSDPMTLYDELATGHAVIIGLVTSLGGHVVVARGMSFQPAPGGFEPLVTLNDPTQTFTQPVPFRAILPIWKAAIVIN